MEAKVYNQTGKEVGKVKLPDSVFGLSWNGDLVHQVIVAMQSNARTPVAHAKDRSEVRGGGRKPWKQKGTGRARHGSIRSPIWIGGGVTHGPRNEKNYKKKINKKMRAKALYTVLSEKFRNGEIVFVDKLEFDAPKTSEARKAISDIDSGAKLGGLLTKKRNAAYIAFADKNENTERSFSNFGNIETGAVKNINPLQILSYKYLVLTDPKESISFIEGRLNKSAKDTKVESEEKPTKKAPVKAKTKAKTNTKAKAKTDKSDK